MKIINHKLFNFTLVLLWFPFMGVVGQEEAMNPETVFSKAQGLAFQGNGREARQLLTDILEAYPRYSDAQTLLANTYRWEGDYSRARKHLNRITSRDRKNEDAWISAIYNERQAGNRSIALGLANKALNYLGENEAISKLRAEIMGTYRADEALAEVEEEAPNYKNRIAIYNRLEAFDAYYDPMMYTSLEYQRNTKYGKVIPRVNYSNRFGMDALQYDLDLYPTLSNTFYAYVNYGFSDSELYPNHKGALEVYANLPKAMETSLGARFLDFRNVNATLLTASVGIYRGNYYLSIRPYLSIVGGRGPVGSGTMTVRKYLTNNFNYLGLTASFGYSPELRQLFNGDVLQAESVLFLESQQLFFEYQFGPGKGKHLYQAQFGVGRQEYLLESGAFFWVVSGGLNYRLQI
ncbi:YaiO family outer membrane beta-barrel protein [Robiginitalea aurantiaca]|uniref:YaiO family outer membrane beta-barrel protein n=1 Tax=Robiginitalea aurantiaca TaxID=3056915 RepID=A0ABT7WFS3_9FLAO|nr:YaiO family outer membrane beta-barrel protein [Robiginitalea aurantiaca]MDM9631765.1 YaiO family outer membrane beta-barrel protein [Robiginitalea aurantiaca]